VLGPLQAAQALGDDGGDGRKRILDAVVQFLKDQLLKLVGRLALSGVDTGLGKQTPRISCRALPERAPARRSHSVPTSPETSYRTRLTSSGLSTGGSASSSLV